MAGKQRQGDFLLHKKIPWEKAEVVRGTGQAAREKGSKKRRCNTSPLVWWIIKDSNLRHPD